MNKIGLITGASGGIGQAITQALLDKLDAIVLIDINQNKLKVLRKSLGNSIPMLSMVCDVSDAKEINNALATIKDKIGIPNILINNAGFGGPFNRINEISDHNWSKIIHTNLSSIFYLSRGLLPHMKTQGFGRIVNIASMQGLFGGIGSAAYIASKHGVVGLTKAIAAEWGEQGIHCNAICPGYVDTPMGPKAVNNSKIIQKIPLKRLAKASEVGSLVAFLISNEATYINGSIIQFDGGMMSYY